MAGEGEVLSVPFTDLVSTCWSSGCNRRPPKRPQMGGNEGNGTIKPTMAPSPLMSNESLAPQVFRVSAVASKPVFF